MPGLPVFSRRASFTLIELLIVIAVVAVLSVIVIVVLNPIQLLRQARDSNRLTDMNTLVKALSIYEADVSAGSLGAVSTVYVSVPDPAATSTAGTDCAGLGLGTPGGGFAYHCAASSTYRKTDGTGWIPVDFRQISAGSPISSLPVDPTNTTSTGLYYTYVTGGSYKLTALLESAKYQGNALTDGGTSSAVFERGSNLALAPGVFPGGWISLPNGTFVMQYEAKYDKDGDGQGDTASAANCPADSGAGLDWRDSGCGTAGKIVSTANGAPIVHITHDQAKAACAALGAHVIRNDEWMAIARDAEQVASNWSSGTVGSGCLFRGNVGAADSCGYDGADPEQSTGRNAKAKLTLSNGAGIWDIAGNVWEHVLRDANDTLTTDVDHPDTASGGAAFNWREFTAITSYGALSYDIIRPSNVSWDASYGMGRIYTCDSCSGSTQRVFLRGGYWADGADVGAFTLLLAWTPSTQDGAVGFRCAR